jgi:hypothetical protein
MCVSEKFIDEILFTLVNFNEKKFSNPNRFFSRTYGYFTFLEDVWSMVVFFSRESLIPFDEKKEFLYFIVETFKSQKYFQRLFKESKSKERFLFFWLNQISQMLQYVTNLEVLQGERSSKQILTNHDCRYKREFVRRINKSFFSKFPLFIIQHWYKVFTYNHIAIAICIVFLWFLSELNKILIKENFRNCE